MHHLPVPKYLEHIFKRLRKEQAETTKTGIVFGSCITRQYYITRVILAPNDLFTPFDLKAQTFRVNVEWSTYYHGPMIHGHTKKIVEPEGYFRTFFHKNFY